jgi:hypothetical protein
MHRVDEVVDQLLNIRSGKLIERQLAGTLTQYRMTDRDDVADHFAAMGMTTPRSAATRCASS